MASPLPKAERVFNSCCDDLERIFPDVGAVELHLDEAAGKDNGAGADRQFAYCKDGDPIVIAFASKVEKLPLSRIKGLMRHEFGHALEYRYGIAELERRLRKKLPPGTERRADVIAETVWKEPIRYDSRDIQCVGVPGKSPRPGHLAKNSREPWYIAQCEGCGEDVAVYSSRQYGEGGEGSARCARCARGMRSERAGQRVQRRKDWEVEEEERLHRLEELKARGPCGECVHCQDPFDRGSLCTRWCTFPCCRDGKVTENSSSRGPRWSPSDSPLSDPAFVEWFGASAVRDRQGRPLVVYHGAPDAAGIFRDGFQKSMMRGHSYFATDSASVARTYADAHRAFDYQSAEPGVIPLYLSIQNPMVLDAAGEVWKGTEAWVEKARSSGHDGLIIRQSRDTYNESEKAPLSTVYVWFDPTQAKSAADGPLRQSGRGALPEQVTGSGPNRGSWDPSNPRIRENPFDPEQIRMGTKHEMEHTDDPEEARRIAEDHLREIPDYYTRLDKLEERFKKGLPPNPMRSNPPATLPVGTVMFHGTLEPLRGRLRAGGDGLLWFADCPAIAQLYLARSGARMLALPEHLKNPSQSRSAQRIQEQLGILFSDVEWDDFGRLQSWARPEGWDRMPTKEDVISRLGEMGYEPKKGGVYELLMHDGELLPARGYARGTLVIAMPRRSMRIWSMAESEGDLHDPQYNWLDRFQKLREQGYDGVLINDFAQSENWGNLGHLSVGLFPEAISDLSMEMRPATYHEFEMGHYHTPEYPAGPVSDFRTVRDGALQPNVDDLRDIARRDREAKRRSAQGDHRSPAERRREQLEAARFPEGVDYEALILEEDEENEG